MSAESMPYDDVALRANALLPTLSGALRRVAEHLLADLPAGAHSTIVELAERSGTSPATVTRFSRALGFDGYAALRLQLATESGRAAGEGWDVAIGNEVAPGDPIDRVAAFVSGADVRAIRGTVAQLDLAIVKKVAGALAAAHRIDLYGIGNSATVAGELHLRLHRIGLCSWAWAEVHDGLTSAALLGRKDAALAISHSGRTAETLAMLTEAARRGATTIALTNFPDSPIAQLADLVLTTAVYETTFRPGSIAARHSQLTVIDLVYIAVAQRTHRQATDALAATAQAVAGHRVGAAGAAASVKKERQC